MSVPHSSSRRRCVARLLRVIWRSDEGVPPLLGLGWVIWSMLFLVVSWDDDITGKICWFRYRPAILLSCYHNPNYIRRISNKPYSLHDARAKAQPTTHS